MNLNNKHLLVIILVVAVISLTNLAITVSAKMPKAVSVPNEFVTGNTILASEMNANFDYLEGEIETNQTDISELQGISTYKTTEKTTPIPFDSRASADSHSCDAGDIIVGCGCGNGSVYIDLQKVWYSTVNRTCECAYHNRHGSTNINVDVVALCLDLP